MRTRIALAAIAGSLALGGCADYGYGYGPYGGVSVGLGYGGGWGGYGGYDDPYDYGYGYSPFDYGGWWGDPYFGWYDGGYYPGVGIYVYDSYRRPHRWSEAQEHYWTERRESVMNSATTRNYQRPQFRENWGGFNQRGQGNHDRSNWHHG